MQECRVYTFNVGQGLFNLMIGTANDGKLYTAVFDCGNFPEYQDKIQEACNLLNSISCFSTITDVVISHQDIDHWRNFMDFLMQLNGIKYDEKIWYLNPAEIPKFFLLSKKCISNASFHQDSVTGEHFFHHVLACDYENSMVYADCFLYEKSLQSSNWNLSFYSNHLLLKIILKMTPDTSDHFDLTVYYGISQKSSSNIACPNLQKTIIDLIDIRVFTDIVSNFHNIFPKLIFKYKCLLEFCQNAKVISKTVQTIYFGGLDQEIPYRMFIMRASNFARFTNDKTYFYTHITPETIRPKLITDSLIDNNILDGSGKPISAKGSVYKNATSQITSVSVSKEHFLLFPGDATVHTFLLLQKCLPEKMQPALFLAPHHGSYKSNFSFQVKEDRSISVAPDQPLEHLLKNFSPAIIHISAEHKKFGHPSEYFVTLCADSCTTQVKPHSIIYCSNHTIDEKNTILDKAVFSTESGNNLLFSFTSTAEHEFSDRLEPAAAVSPRQLPSNDLFLSYGGFNL